MTVSERVHSLRDAVIPSVSAALNRSSLLSTAYGRLWRSALSVGDDTRTARVGEVTATFEVATRSEYQRVRRLGGERHVLERLLADLDGSETVWDVGACIGTYACFLARHLQSGRVVAFEPAPANRPRLRRNLAINAAPDRWRVSPVALFDRDASHSLAAQFHEAGGGHYYLSEAGSFRVDTRPGDGMVAAGLPAPDVLKIDVQGAELRVLRGLADTLPTVDAVYLELHTEETRRYGDTPQRVREFLQDRGFAVDSLPGPSTNRSGVSFVRATRPGHTGR